MSLVDFVEAWWISVQSLLEAAGMVGRFERSPIDRSNPSCTLSFRRNGQEADLLVWESGEAELATIERGGTTDQQHFDDVRTPSTLGMILSRCIHLA